MKLDWTLLAAFNILLVDVASSLLHGTSVTTKSLVKKAGYPYEEHVCETSDGYILTLHRIPYSTRVNTSTPRPVAFLMHGLLASSNDWVVLGPDRALSYILSNAGYDVWMGNARGSRYSRKHKTLSPLSTSFWNFSFHEIAMFDLPDMIDCVRLYTGVDQVRYVGHSQGSTIFFILMSLNPNFNSRVTSSHLLAPVAYMNHIKFPLRDIGASLLGGPAPLEAFGSFELFPNTELQELLADAVCSDISPTQILCTTAIFFIFGFDPDNLNTTMLPVFLATIPAGSSAKQVIHYAQEIKSGYFRQFDYGSTLNLHIYGSEEPPNYPVEKINVPTFLYYGQNDNFVSLIDVRRMINRLSNTTLRGAYLVPHSKWNHADFIWGTTAKEQVYDPLMTDMASIQ